MKMEAGTQKVVVAGALNFLCGGLIGLVIGLSMAVRDSSSGKANTLPQSGESAVKEELAHLRNQIKAQDELIRRLEADPGRGESAPQPKGSLISKRAHAAATYAAFKENAGGGIANEEATKRAMALAGSLDEDMGGFFVETYKKGGMSDPDLIALTLGLMCGGPEVTALLVERFNDHQASRMELNNLCRAVSGIDGWITAFDKLKLTEGVRELSLRLVKSENPLERRGGAGLMGIAFSSEGEEALKALAWGDTNGYVRAAALRSLGRVGGEDTASFLKASLARTEATEADAESMKIREAIKAAMEELERRKLLQHR